MKLSERLKQLEEKRGESLKNASALIEKARTEKRELNADEQTKLAGWHGEAESAAKTAEAEMRQYALEGEKGPEFSPQEKRDQARFDYGKLLRGMEAAMKGSTAHKIEGIEAEMVSEGEKEARSIGVPIGSGLHLPRSLVSKRAVTATGQTSVAGDQGGQTIQTNVMGLLDAFYSALVIPSMGATVLNGLTGNFSWPRYVKPSNPGAKTENGTADGLSPTVSSITFAPQRLPAYIDISQQLLIQSNEVIEAVLRSNLQTQAAVLFQDWIVNGAGHGSNQPQGILGVSGIGSVAGGTNGANPLWKHIVGIKSKVNTANALLGNLGWLINTATEAQLQTQIKNDATGTDSRYILDPDLGLGRLAGYKDGLTNSVPSNLTKGTATSICSAIIFGNFSDLVIANWGGATLELVRDVAGAKAGQYTLVLNTYADSNVVRAESFSAMKDALTPNA